jgi:hypothetical protein
VSVLVALAAGLIAVLLGPGCSNQGVGQQCSIDNQNTDCETGLVCVSKTELGGLSDICCPPSGSNDPACIPNVLTGAGGGGGADAGGQGGAGGAGGGSQDGG